MIKASASKVTKDTKPGKVLRVDPTLYKYLAKKKRSRESWSSVLRRELSVPPKKGKSEFTLLFALPSDLHESLAEAKGTAIMRAVRTKAEPERPLKLRLIE